MKKFFGFFVLVSFLASPFSAFAQQAMSSATYKIESDSLNNSGVRSTSASFGVEDTVGELATGRSNSTNFGLFEAGYQGMRTGIAAPTSVPPSTPTGLVATVQSSTSIDLTWDASTDDYGVSGYYIYRDGVRITDTADFPREYLNSGLTPSTIYLYNVSAFDADGNESLWSATTTATTSSAPTSVSGPSSTSHSRLINFSITPDSTSATLSFDTLLPARVKLDWGTQDTYGQHEEYNTDATQHRFILRNLLPNTHYLLKISLTDASGSVAYGNISFLTLKAPLVVSPTNVTHFKVLSRLKTIDLSWKNSPDPRAIGVRVVRSTHFYPSDPNNGEPVFEGWAESWTDTKVTPGVTYYYAVFSIDLAGNFSSGSVGSGRVLLPGESTATTTPLEVLPKAGNVDPMIAGLTLEDFLFIQNGNSRPIKNGAVAIDATQNMTVALKYGRVPAVLKTIAVTLLTRPQNGGDAEFFTFILKANRDKTRYEATVGPLEETSDYSLRLTVIDFKNQAMKKIEGTLRSVTPSSLLEVTNFRSQGGLMTAVMFFVLILLSGLAFHLKKRVSAKPEFAQPTS